MKSLYKARNRARVVFTTSLLSFWSGIFMPSVTENAIANGDTRTIYLHHAHRNESIAATYRVNGHYDPAVLAQLNHFLRDWRNDDEINMDPRLFDVVWEVYRKAGANQEIQVLSAYRSPETNAMLRRRSRAVAEHSQHMLGKAMDTTMPDMSMEQLREIGMRMQRGGVGYYPNENFVHLDVGSVRHWPRMNYDQLVRLFPDGKTVHIPSNGQPLARYEEARAEIEANGGIAPGYEEQPKSKGFFAWLFGGGGGEDDAEEVAAESPRASKRGASRAVAVAQQAQPASERPEPTQTAAAPQQVASLNAAREPRKDAPSAAEADTSAYGALPMPMPPRRPSELAAANVPLPPMRPTLVASLTPNDVTASIPGDSKGRSAAKPDSIAGLISQQPVTARTALPSVITQGPGYQGTAGSRSVQQPAELLAYAPSAQPGVESVAPTGAGLRLAAQAKAAMPVPRPGSNRQNAIVSARLDGSNFRSLISDASEAQTTSQSVLGPSLHGLRAAAQTDAGTLSNKPSANYIARFADRASDLDTRHFSGPAVQPVATASESLQQIASFKPLN